MKSKESKLIKLIPTSSEDISSIKDKLEEYLSNDTDVLISAERLYKSAMESNKIPESELYNNPLNKDCDCNACSSLMKLKELLTSTDDETIREIADSFDIDNRVNDSILLTNAIINIVIQLMPIVHSDYPLHPILSYYIRLSYLLDYDEELSDVFNYVDNKYVYDTQELFKLVVLKYQEVEEDISIDIHITRSIPKGKFLVVPKSPHPNEDENYNPDHYIVVNASMEEYIKLYELTTNIQWRSMFHNVMSKFELTLDDYIEASEYAHELKYSRLDNTSLSSVKDLLSSIIRIRSVVDPLVDTPESIIVRDDLSDEMKEQIVQFLKSLKGDNLS